MLRKRRSLVLSILIGALACTPAKQDGVRSREAPAAAADALEFGQGGMGGNTSVRWDPGTGKLSYQENTPSKREAWESQPSPEEWARFWKAMDELGVWDWKADYGETMLHTDCVSWGVTLTHGTRRMSSRGCDMYPDGGWQVLVAEVARLRGGPEAAMGQAQALSKRLKEDPSWKMRIDAAVALGGMGPAGAPGTPALIEVLGWPTPPGQEMFRPRLADAATGALASIGEPAIPEVTRAMNDENPDRRYRAALALAGMGATGQKTSIAIALTEALKYPPVRQAAARTLVRIDPRTVPTVIPILIEGLGDPDRDVAAISAAALGRIPAAVAPLAQALEDPKARGGALTALAQMGRGAGGAVPQLVKVLKDKNEGPRSMAAYALREIGPGAVAAVPALVDTLNHDSSGGVREAAARALGGIGRGASAGVPALINALRYGDAGYSIASGALGSLYQIGDPAIPALIAALSCTEKDLLPRTPMSSTGFGGVVRPEVENVRAYAASGLGSMGIRAKAAVPALTEALRDEHPFVRERAAFALKEIQRQ